MLTYMHIHIYANNLDLGMKVELESMVKSLTIDHNYGNYGETPKQQNISVKNIPFIDPYLLDILISSSLKED